MAETKEDVVAERDALRADNDALRAQLAAATAPAAGLAAPVQHRFQLSEGDRQDLELRGFINVNGRVMTKDDVLGALEPDQSGVEIADASDEALALIPHIVGADRGKGVAGLDYIGTPPPAAPVKA